MGRDQDQILKLADVEQPHNLEAERALLGSLMLDSDLYSFIEKIIEKDSFYNTTHQYIFEAISGLYHNELPIDTISIMNELKKLNHEVVLSYVANLPDTVPLSSNILYYTGIVKKDAEARHLMRGGVEIINMSNIPTATTEEVIEAAEQGLEEIKRRLIPPEQVEFTGSELSDYYANFFDTELTAIHNGSKRNMAMPLGYENIDEFIFPERSQQIILAARSNNGKSSMAIDILGNALDSGKNVDFYSLEMHKHPVSAKLLSWKTGVPINQLNLRGKLPSNENISKINLGLNWLKEKDAQLKVFAPTSKVTVNKVVQDIRRGTKKGRVPDIIILDHLGELKYNSFKASERADEIGEACSMLRKLAQELNALNISLVQINRSGVEQPRPEHLAGSDRILQVTDILLIMHRPDKAMTKESAAQKGMLGVVDVLIGKHRDGFANEIKKLYYDGEFSRYRQMDMIYNGRIIK